MDTRVAIAARVPHNRDMNKNPQPLSPAQVAVNRGKRMSAPVYSTSTPKAGK